MISYYGILLGIHRRLSLEVDYENNYFKNHPSTYKTLNKLVKATLVKKGKGKDCIGDVYSLT